MGMELEAKHRKSEARADLRRKQIFEAAGRVFARKGFHSATVQDVADEAGLGKGTLYEYVQSKRELLFLVVEEGQNLLLEAVENEIPADAPPEQKLRLFVSATLHLIEEHRNLAGTLTIEIESIIHLPESSEEKQRIEAIKMKYIRTCQSILEEGVRAGVVKPVNTLALSEVILECCHLWAHSDTIPLHSGRVEEYEKLLQSVLFEGILQKESPTGKE